jgi:hypothetical protein
MFSQVLGVPVEGTAALTVATVCVAYIAYESKSAERSIAVLQTQRRIGIEQGCISQLVINIFLQCLESSSVYSHLRTVAIAPVVILPSQKFRFLLCLIALLPHLNLQNACGIVL